MTTNKSLWVKPPYLKLGESGFGFHGKKIGSIRQIVHDATQLTLV